MFYKIVFKIGLEGGGGGGGLNLLPPPLEPLEGLVPSKDVALVLTVDV